MDVQRLEWDGSRDLIDDLTLKGTADFLKNAVIPLKGSFFRFFFHNIKIIFAFYKFKRN